MQTLNSIINNVMGSVITATIVLELAATGILLIMMWIKSTSHTIKYFRGKH